MTEPLEKIKAPCSKCMRETTHQILFNCEKDGSDYAMIACGGCEAISMRVKDLHFTDQEEFYPSPVSRQMPMWLQYMRLGLDADEEILGDLLTEVYQAIFGRQYRLAAMGIRAALEQIMIMKIGDKGSFNQKLEAFERAGFISKIQREAMRTTLDVGDAAMHRGFAPTDEDLRIALDIVEGVMAPIFGHADEAKGLGKRVPPRKNNER
ncbi:DUF4145 domain-containing protein [Bradyrhizobium liaoningense]|uniref:DUF4145 domain-containing protein n=1 Tax=Bradyrhizobium liaoningense TaxID=43992 RepID=UPI001BA6F8EB|nr:DUF4145 domain-containing protein [Bradyrhizobium liaoningense]MBR0710902.1 DUF4145 domain-containing protein [Bradyrhizobium liaoningense]